MKRILDFKEYKRLILETEDPTKGDESHYPDLTGDEIAGLKSEWDTYRSMDSGQKDKFKEKVYSIVQENLSKAKNHFLKYFSDPEVVKKIKSISSDIKEEKVEKKLNSLKFFIEGIEAKVVIKKNIFTNSSSAWGSVSAMETDLINLNIFNFWKEGNDAKIYETILHEMSHCIDFFFRKEGIRTETVQKMFSDETYTQSTMEQYARLQNVRKDLGLSPIAREEEVLKKILDLFKEGKIKIKDNPVVESNPSEGEDGTSIVFTLKRKSNTSPSDPENKEKMRGVFDSVFAFAPDVSSEFTYFISNFSRISEDQMSIILDIRPLVQYHNQVANQERKTEEIA